MTLKYKDSHEQDFHLLKQRQESILQQGRISDICESLIFLFLCHKFAAEDDAIQEAMTDGGNDLGIDAVFIDYRPIEPAIHLVQSKQYNSEPKSRNSFKVSALDRMTKFDLSASVLVLRALAFKRKSSSSDICP